MLIFHFYSIRYSLIIVTFTIFRIFEMMKNPFKIFDHKPFLRNVLNPYEKRFYRKFCHQKNRGNKYRNAITASNIALFLFELENINLRVHEIVSPEKQKMKVCDT